MPSFTVENVEKLWDTWNIRGLIILSLLLQSFLILSAQLRKQRGGKWIIMIPLWIAYLLADWVATFTIGLMMRAERSDILAFWAPFLLLHLGGPDTITSFSLEDNEFWIRHLLGLILQVGSTIYVILQSLPHNKLWLPAFLVLIAGIIKYAERNRAFYLASFDHFGNNWASIGTVPPMPVQFNRDQPKYALLVKYTFGAVKSLLVGPPLANIQKLTLLNFMRQEDSHVIRQTIETHLSLLYELLYSKLPVVDSKIGYVCRIVNFGCILGALVSFPILLNRYYHNKFVEFDIWLTYGLLIGALALDLISILLLISSDWIILAHARKVDFHEFFNRCRWSNSIPQLNILACHFKTKDEDYSNKLVDFLGINSFFENIRRLIQCVSFKDFVEDEAWNFIFTTLKEKHVAGRGMFLPGILHGDTHDTNFNWSIDKFEYLESLLMWHIATEICYRIGGPDKSPSTSAFTSRSFDHREICKLLSDYMFYLLVMEPTTIAVSPNSLKMVFEGEKVDTTWRWPRELRGEKGSKETFNKDKALDNLLVNEKSDVRNLLDKIKIDVDKLSYEQMLQTNQISRVTAACYLAKELLNRPSGCPWELMGRFWIEIVCYAANNCQPIVHARQVSRGGQFLTLVWLLINYLGLTPSLSEWSDALERKVLTDQKKELKESGALEQNEPADKKKELQEPKPADQRKKRRKEPAHELEITSTTS